MGRMKRQQWIVIAVMWLVFGLMVTSIGRKSPTVDEQSHLFRGVAYLETGATHFLLGHPLGASVLSALPVITETELQLPTETTAWADGDWSLAGDAFMWRSGNAAQRLIWLGRLPVMLLTLLLGALVFRWGSDIAGAWAGLLAAAILLFDPNVLAHGRLITGDMALTLFFVLSIYAYWRWVTARGVEWVNVLLIGVGVGLAALAKFNAGLLVPVLGLMALGLAWRRKSFRPILILIPAAVISVGLIWAFSGFDLTPLPGGAFWDDLFWELDYFGGQHGSYFNGQFSVDGWWYYFPAAYLLKTPLPTLFWLGLAFVLALVVVRRRVRVLTQITLLLPVAIYVGFSLTSSLNIGVRYLLPVLPFLYLWAAAIVVTAWQMRPARWLVTAAGGVAIALAGIAVISWPNYIPFFNQFAGGAENGWRWLSDSNVDWGQDLPALAAWQAEHPAETLLLSYFGTAHPSAYGIVFEPLPMWSAAPEQGNPARQAFYPPDPAPGVYALSVTSLHGVVLNGATDTLAYFRDREPDERLGDSIFIYRVASVGDSAEIAFGSAVPADLSPEQFARLGTNDLQVRWFDPNTTLVWPDGAENWLAVGAFDPDPLLAEFWPDDLTLPNADVQLVQPEPFPDGFDPAVAFGEGLTLLGYRVSAENPGQIAVISAWQVEDALPDTLKLFVHATDSADATQILTQWDGIGVDPASLQVGDRFVQVQRFATPATAYTLWLGVYDDATRQRPAPPILLVP